jgi:glycosyltransferase involved in cell wall biosynthesis
VIYIGAFIHDGKSRTVILQIQQVWRYVSNSVGDKNRTQLSSPADCRGMIEWPGENKKLPRLPVRLAGWALLGAPVSRVEIVVDGEIQGLARLGGYRPEVETIFPGSPDAIIAGFEYLLDLAKLGDKRSAITVKAVAYGLNESRYEISPITIRLCRREYFVEDHIKREDETRALSSAKHLGESSGSRAGINILVFTHDLGYGGAQLYLYELLRRLSDNDGFTCTVIAPEDGPLRSLFQKLKIRVHLAGKYPRGNIRKYKRMIEDLLDWAQPHGFNVALVNTVIALPGPEVATRLGIPFVWAIHESYEARMLWSGTPRRRRRRNARIYIHHRAIEGLRTAAAVVFEADATRIQYQSYGEPERFITVPYGINIEHVENFRATFRRSKTRERLGIPRDSIAILCMGTFEPRKAQIPLVQAFREVVGDHPEAFLILVGDTGSPYAKAVRSYVASAELQDRVLIVPIVSEPYEWYGSADLLVCSSDLESLPRSVLEAMAFELPVLATSVFGIPELIKDGETGYLYQPRDLTSLIKALRRVLNQDQNERRELAIRSANLVRVHYDSRGYADAYLRMMRGLIENSMGMPRDISLD